MAKFWKNNGLTIVLMLLFAASIVGQWVTGWRVENEELARHGEATVSLGQYFFDPQFQSTIFENWESEFLQMAVFIVLTGILVQKGSPESRDPDKPSRDSNLARQARRKDAPYILRAGRLARTLYGHSLGIVLFLLFAGSFVLHWVNSARVAAEQAIQHGEPAPTVIAYLGDPQLWFESFQNWQSEFLSTAALVVLSIFLRQRESPESKAVAAPHRQTGA